MTLYTADASKVTPAEFARDMLPPIEPHVIRELRHMLSLGKVDEARSYLDANNAFARAFGHPEYELPGDLDLTICAGDPLLRKDLAA